MRTITVQGNNENTMQVANKYTTMFEWERYES